MRDEIVKYLGTVEHSSAKSISEKLGLDRLEVAKELNHMHTEALVEREKRGGGGNEYVYWLARADAGVGMHPDRPEPSSVECNPAPSTPPIAAAKAEVPHKHSAIEQDRDRLQAEVLDLRITASNQREKIRVLEAQKATLESSIKQGDDRYNALCADRAGVAAEILGVRAANAKLVQEVETLREQVRAQHQPIGASVAEALKPFLLPGQKIIWREPFRWHDEDGVMPNHFEGLSVEELADNFGYQIVINCELAAIIQPHEERKNDASDAVGSAEAAGVR